MARVTRIGTEWKATNYVGELFAADTSQTPLLSMIGGLTGGRHTTSDEFPTAVLFDYPQPIDREVSKVEDEQETNVVQAYREKIDLSYMKTSDGVEDERAYQMHHKLVKMARDIEHSFLNGSFQKAECADDENRTRGLIELTKTRTMINAQGGMLTKNMLNSLYRQMTENGAYFDNIVMFLPAYQKQIVTDIYAKEFNATLDIRENIGGVSVVQIETDKFKMGVAWNRFIPKDTILLVDVAHLAPVFQVVPEKGVVYAEEVADNVTHICSDIGLAHGPAFLHGSIINLAVE